MPTDWHALLWGDAGWGDELARGLLLTLQVSGAAFALALAFGLLGALGRLSASPPARAVAWGYATLVRALPELLVVLVVYFTVATGAERLLCAVGMVEEGFRFSPFWAAVAALATVCGAFMTEVLRAGIEAVPRGQVEAGLAIGMPRRTLMLRVVGPQALRHAAPALGNLWLSITKDSAVVSVLGSFGDLLAAGTRAAAATKSYALIYGATALIFLGISLASAFLIRRIERELNRGQA